MRLHELIDSGELGDLQHVEATMIIPAPDDDDPRWSLPLAGGALMDLGCYALHAHRMLAPWARGADARGRAGRGARGQARRRRVDRRRPGVPNGATGSARCNMAGEYLRMTCRIVGSRGEATAANFVLPHQDDRIFVATPAGDRIEQLGTRCPTPTSSRRSSRGCATASHCRSTPTTRSRRCSSSTSVTAPPASSRDRATSRRTSSPGS